MRGRTGSTKRELERKYGRDGVEVCPACGKTGDHSHIVRHLMNSAEAEHVAFVAEQDNRLVDLFDRMPAEECSVANIAFSAGVFCSPSRVRTVLDRCRPEWKRKLASRRAADTSKQYADGRRSRPKRFAGGVWQPSKEEGTGNYLDKEKRDAVIRLFGSDHYINAVAAIAGCKNSTVSKIWQEEFGAEQYRERLRATWCFRKPDAETEEKIRSLFDSNKSMREVAGMCDTNPEHVKRIWIDHAGTQNYKRRARKMRGLSIKKSFEAMGRMTASGHGSQPEYDCFCALSKRLASEPVIHHDLDIAPPYEVDITLPERKLAVSWDGPMHRRPIFGSDKLRRVRQRDSRKIDILRKKGWRVVVIEDDSSKAKYIDMDRVVSFILRDIQQAKRTIRIDRKGGIS